MNAKVVYFTKSGHTEKIANAIGETMNCQVTNIDNGLKEPVDILFLGASVYNFGIDKKVFDFIDNLNASEVGSVAIFSTSAISDSGFPKLKKRLVDKGITVCNNHFYCKGKFMMLNKNRPDSKDIDEVKEFARSIANN